MKFDINEVQSELQPVCQGILKSKYCLEAETTVLEVQARTAKALAKDAEQEARFFTAMRDGFVGGGRIHSGAGSGLATTLINCFVIPVGDSVSGLDDDGQAGIFDALLHAGESLRKGGGVGYDFSSIRPLNAKVKGTNSLASGPVSYMRVFDRMCETVASAGGRRGAQMGVLRIDHPDIELFIDAKATPDFGAMGLNGKDQAQLLGWVQNVPSFGWPFRKAFATLSNFNLSVAVTDDFMEAVINDEDFDLVHKVGPREETRTKVCVDGVTRHIYRTVKARMLWNKIMLNTFNAAEPGILFIDRINNLNNLRYTETIHATNPCGEQSLPAYGCCDLGHANLSRFVRNAFTAEAYFDWDAYAAVIKTAIEILDRVLDVTNWPLPQQKAEAESKRRIGHGFFALADAMAMLGIRYDREDGVEFAQKVSSFLRDNAYQASVELAKQYGAFPLFDADKYLAEGTFASTLPESLKAQIREHGIRNSHLLSIAPTGTVAMGFGNNASSGLEPIFARRQKRNIIAADGERAVAYLDNAAYARYKQMFGPDAESDVFVEAEQMSVDAHLRIVEAVAGNIDAAISKTVNCPADYPFEDFENVYMRAYKMGLKGITTYRPNVMVGSVLSSAEAKPAASVPTVQDLREDDPDRRIELKDTQVATEALSWPGRPLTPNGTQSQTYHCPYPGADFAVIVGHYTNGRNHPLEVYIAGNEQPRGLAAIAKSLSVDMRTKDPAWLRMKIESLCATQGDDGFEMTDPETGNVVVAPSLVAGLGRLVRHRLRELGTWGLEGDSPMVEALFSKREPKTGPNGSIGWHVDILNPVTGDDFLMHTKEVKLADGTVRPYSVWLSGKYPRVLDGLTRMLSIDMRVSDPAWALMKLSKLVNFGEQRGDFLAAVPGENGQKNYPSTVAYMAAVLIERYRVLGLGSKPLALSEEGIHQGGASNTRRIGMMCPSCHALALHKRAGCEECENCSYTGSCG